MRICCSLARKDGFRRELSVPRYISLPRDGPDAIRGLKDLKDSLRYYHDAPNAL